MFARFGLILCLCFGVLLPRVSGAVLSLVPGVSMAVICTGTQMTVLHIGADGQPIEQVLDEPHQCLRAAAVPQMAPLCQPEHRLILSHALLLPAQTNALAAQSALKLQKVKRAPPLV